MVNLVEGKVVGIFIATGAKTPVKAVTEAHAVPGKGIEGDRYFTHTGSFSEKPGDGREITLIELESVEAAKRDYGVEIQPGESRRNVVTRGIALNHLVGREFDVGKVRLKGIRLCEPCDLLQDLTKGGIRSALIHRGGLRANIVSDGVFKVGDSISA